MNDLEQTLRALKRSNTVQLVVTIIMGLAAGVMYYAGLVFETTGGWQ